MPARRSRKAIQARRRKRRQQRGAGLFSWIKNKALPWLKKTHLLSTIGEALGAIGVPYAGTAGKMAKAAGYGRRKRIGYYMVSKANHRGGALKLAGAGLNPAGMGRRKGKKVMLLM